MDIFLDLRYTCHIMDGYVDLQESTPFCKNNAFTIIWHFRKFLPCIGMLTAAYRMLVRLLCL